MDWITEEWAAGMEGGLMLSPAEKYGLEEQIKLDRDQIDREWAKKLPNTRVMEQLQRHIDYCRAKIWRNVSAGMEGGE